VRYFYAPELEYHESRGMALIFGKRYTPDAQVTLTPEVVVDTRATDLLDVDGEILAMEPDGASWSFLNPREARVVQDLAGGRSLRWLMDHWGADAPRSADAFVGELYRRGLATLNGQRSVDARMFEDSHNTREKNLVELLLTEKCNLACGYCLAGTKPDMPSMTWEIAQRTIDLAFDMNEADNISFQFSGGEPFMRYDLMKRAVDYIEHHPGTTGRQVYFSIQTNGTLLTDERIQWCKEHEIQIGLSIDGTADSQNKARPFVNGKPSYEKVMEGMKLLQKNGVCFGAIVVLSRANIGRAQDLIDFMLGNGINAIKLNPIAYIGTGRDNWNELGLTQDEITEYVQQLVEIVARDKVLLNEANVASMLTHVISKQRATRCLRGYCGAGRTFQAINAAGDIHPCGRGTQTPAMKLGSVLTERRSLSHPAREHPLIQQMEVRRPKGLEDCDTCTFRELCQAGCAVEALERYGTVRHKTPECQYSMTMYPWLMRRLAFDAPAVDHFSACHYFAQGQRVQVVAEDFLPSAGAVRPLGLKPAITVVQKAARPEAPAVGHKALPILA
jgi:uncharacterized protein